MATKEPTPELIAFIDDLKSVMGRHPGLPAIEMLAGVAQLCGNLIALQDRRKYSSATIMEMVGKNIEIGNAEAINTFANTPTFLRKGGRT